MNSKKKINSHLGPDSPQKSSGGLSGEGSYEPPDSVSLRVCVCVVLLCAHVYMNIGITEVRGHPKD